MLVRGRHGLRQLGCIHSCEARPWQHVALAGLWAVLPKSVLQIVVLVGTVRV